MFELLLLLCRIGRRQQRNQGATTNTNLPSATGGSSQDGTNEKFGSMESIDLMEPKYFIGNQLTFVNLICCLAIAGLLIQSGCEAKKTPLESQDGKPCICNSTFYKQCPPARDCMENNLYEEPTSTTTRRPLNDYDPLDDPFDPDYHDDYDPDHVPDYNPPNPFYDTYRKPKYDDLPLPFDSESSQPDRIVRHRKVYVAQRKAQGDVPIHPIRIRIPVRVPEYQEPNLPDPKPVYKLRKYTTYENRPEVQMVPVTKTIIKPVGVSPDQIIDESGGSKKYV